MEKLIPLTVTLPEEVHAKIQEAARSQYLSRSAVVRRLIIQQVERLEAQQAQLQPEAAA